MMKLLLCDVCGSLLIIERAEKSSRGVCRCGFAREFSNSLVFSGKQERRSDKGTGVIKEESSLGFPHICRKCGHDECEVSDLGASYSDESNIYLYKCRKCGHVERQADGTGNI